MKKSIYLLASVFTLGAFVGCGGSDDSKKEKTTEEKLEGRWYTDRFEVTLSSNNQVYTQELETDCDKKAGPEFKLDHTGLSYSTDENANGDCEEETSPFTYNIIDGDKLVIVELGEEITSKFTVTDSKLVLIFNDTDEDQDGQPDELKIFLYKTL